MKYYLTIFTFLLFQDLLFSQDQARDYFDIAGKINVVIAILVIVFFGIVAFLVFMDRRIKKLEIQINNE